MSISIEHEVWLVWSLESLVPDSKKIEEFYNVFENRHPNQL